MRNLEGGEGGWGYGWWKVESGVWRLNGNKLGWWGRNVNGVKLRAGTAGTEVLSIVWDATRCCR